MSWGLQVQLPPNARSLIERLLCSVEDRLGSHGGAAEVKVRRPARMQPCCTPVWKRANLQAATAPLVLGRLCPHVGVITQPSQ